MYRVKQFPAALITSQVFERRTVHFLFMVIVLAFGLYLYAMLSTVSLALHRRTIEVAIRDTVSATATLEGTYLSLTEGLTPETGASLGLTTPKAVAYAREGTGVAVAFAHGI